MRCDHHSCDVMIQRCFDDAFERCSVVVSIPAHLPVSLQRSNARCSVVVSIPAALKCAALMMHLSAAERQRCSGLSSPSLPTSLFLRHVSQKKRPATSEGEPMGVAWRFDGAIPLLRLSFKTISICKLSTVSQRPLLSACRRCVAHLDAEEKAELIKFLRQRCLRRFACRRGCVRGRWGKEWYFCLFRFSLGEHRVLIVARLITSSSFPIQIIYCRLVLVAIVTNKNWRDEKQHY